MYDVVPQHSSTMTRGSITTASPKSITWVRGMARFRATRLRVGSITTASPKSITLSGASGSLSFYRLTYLIQLTYLNHLTYQTTLRTTHSP